MVWPRERPSTAAIPTWEVVLEMLEARSRAVGGEMDEESGGFEDDGEEVTKRSNRLALSRECASLVVMKRLDLGGLDRW